MTQAIGAQGTEAQGKGAYGTGAYRVGRCVNDLYCASASAKQNIQVPAAGQFVCPQCGKALSDLQMEKRGVTGPALAACGALVVTGGALFLVGAMIGKGRPADAMVVQTVPAPRSDFSDTPRPVVNIMRAAPAPSTSAAQPPARRQGATGSLAPRVGAALSGQGPLAAPRGSQAAEAQAKHQAEQTEAREDAAREAKSAELATRDAATQAAAEQQRLAVSKAQDARRKAQYLTLQTEQEARARQDAETAHAAQAAADAQAQARSAADLQARQRAAAVRVAQAPPTRGVTRGFSAAALSGGAPSYPAAYEDGRVGRVTVSCLISQSGSPSGCHVLSSQGGIGFSNAALGWLRSGQVRFAPILRDGVARSEEHSWSMSFEP
jgi:TonB family protein